MSQELSTQSLEDALGSAFGSEYEQPKPEPVEEPAVEESAAEPEEAPAEVVAEPAEETEQEVAEPEYEIEVEGQKHTVRGNDQIRELMQKGLHYTQRSQQTARMQEALMAKAQSLAITEQFQNSVAEDLAALRAIDRALEPYNGVNWADKFDTEPLEAMKFHAQRNELREERNRKMNEITQKWDQFRNNYAAATQQHLAAEHETLLNRVPEWRNAETASKEKGEISRTLQDRYGFNPAELNNLIDHRMMLVARDALRYHQMQAVKTDKVKQAREAPPVVKPGTVQKQTNAKQEFVKVRAHLRQLGAKGNHKAQETLVTEMFSKAFKI